MGEAAARDRARVSRRPEIYSGWAQVYLANKDRVHRTAAIRAQGWRDLLYQSALLSLAQSYRRRSDFRAGLAGDMTNRIVGDDVLNEIAQCLIPNATRCQDDGARAALAFVKDGAREFLEKRAATFERQVNEVAETDVIDQPHPIVTRALFRLSVLERIVAATAKNR